jgi:5'(3')-deoxyribonucleotidase
MSVYLVDVDGVVADSHSEWLRLYNQDYNDTLTSENITTWNTHEFVKPECGNKIYEYLWRPDLYDNVKPIDGALSGIKWIRNQGHRVVFVTSGIQPAKIEWLHRNGFLTGQYWQSDRDVAIVTDKSLIKGDFLIDDRIENCQEFSKYGKSILFSQPWNFGSDLLCVESWAGLISYISKR